MPWRWASSSARAATSYDPTPKDGLSAEVRARGFAFDSELDEVFEGENDAGAVERAYERVAVGEAERANAAASASWRRKFCGQEHELVTDLSFDRTEARRTFDATIAAALPAPGSAYEAIRKETTQDVTRLKVDFNRPVGDTSRLKTGYEFELSDNAYDNFGRRGADALSARSIRTSPTASSTSRPSTRCTPPTNGRSEAS